MWHQLLHVGQHEHSVNVCLACPWRSASSAMRVLACLLEGPKSEMGVCTNRIEHAHL